MSHIEISAALVIRACERYLEEREENIEEIRESAIADEMNARRWFWQRKKTREEAIDSLRSDFINRYNTAHFHCGRQAGRVQHLLTLAKLTGSLNMNLDDQHAADIGSYLREEA